MYRQKSSLTLLYERVIPCKAILVSSPASVVIIGHYKVTELLKHEAPQASHPHRTTSSGGSCVGQSCPHIVILREFCSEEIGPQITG